MKMFSDLVFFIDFISFTYFHNITHFHIGRTDLDTCKKNGQKLEHIIKILDHKITKIVQNVKRKN